MSSVSAIVLAAGFARRMKQKQKLLLPLQQKPILAWVLESLVALPVKETIVVVQSTAPFRHLLTSFPIRWIENPEAECGLARSIQYGNFQIVSWFPGITDSGVIPSFFPPVFETRCSSFPVIRVPPGYDGSILMIRAF